MAPRTFMMKRPAWRTINAHACACHAHTTHNTLLTMKTQKPASRRDFVRDATSQAASSVTAMAGHCSTSSQGPDALLARVCPFERRDIELAHLEQRGHHALGFRVRLTEPLDHLARHDLP